MKPIFQFIHPPEGYEIDREQSTFERIVFVEKKPELPKTWVDFCKNYKVKPGESRVEEAGIYTYTTEHPRYQSVEKHLLPSEELAKAMIALCQLIQLRDCYNAGWQPDWDNSGELKYCIEPNRYTVVTRIHYIMSKVLNFKSKELRDKFLENFRHLIEVARPLL